MKNQAIYVQYLDSALYDSGEFKTDHDFKLVIFNAVGWLLREDEQAIYLAREINQSNKDYVRAVLVIPKIAVLKKKVIKE